MEKRYQFFVSSTYADLKEERTAVIQTIMKMDCIPAGMELFPAIDEEQFLFVKRVIDDCDYYVVIIGGRYGSTTSEGLSYTEKEYDYAVEKGLRIIAFVHEDPMSIPLGKSESDPELRDRLAAFREKVQSGRLVNFWRSAKELPGAVALSLMQTIKLYPATGWCRADQLATSDALSDLNSLRKELASLTTRNKELRAQLAAMKPKLPDLAGLDENLTLSGTRKMGHYSPTDWTFAITWGELFASIAPYILAQPNDAAMHIHFDATVRNLYESRCRNVDDYGMWTLRAEHYQTAKVQFMALGLVTVELQEMINGGLALFWSLTAQGEARRLESRTVKSSRGQAVS